jgi:hypothetical protein
MSNAGKFLTNGLRVFMANGKRRYQLIREGMVTDVIPTDKGTPLTPGLYDLELNYLGPEAPDGSLQEEVSFDLRGQE